MYLRTIQRRNKDGSTVRYVQLAHNARHPETGSPVAEVIHSFGREDTLDRASLARLVRSINRYLGPEAELASSPGGEGLAFVSSRAMGGTWALDGLWRRLGVGTVLKGLLAGSRRDPGAERVLFALVANRALAPCSKLAATRWVGEVAWVPGLAEVSDDACYRAMDWLLEVEGELAERVYWSVATLLNLEVDLLFFDTTSTYFEIDEADPPAEGQAAGFRTWGHSKDHRALPQVVVGLAVTRSGIPIRCWCWPGNTSDSALIRQVKDDLRDWKLARVVWVGDRGFASAENRRYLQRAGGHYIMGEKLRGASSEAAAALARQGRYHVVADNLRVKEVVVDEGVMRDRFVVCYNPEEAARDEGVRRRLLAQLEEAIKGSDRLPKAKREALAARLRSSSRELGRLLRTTPGGLLRIDRAAVRADARLDGKFLLRTSDPTLSAEDVALGYKQLIEVERCWRDMKTTLELRPVYHRLEQRIRAHVVLCWLALLLVRLAEGAAGDTWRNLRHELERMHLGEFVGSAGRVLQRTETTARQKAILKALGVAEPKRFLDIAPEPAADTA